MNQGQEYDELFKILLLGDSGVGKSCIIKQYTENKFDSNILSSIGVDFKSKTTLLGNKSVMIQIWDTAGQERFKTITTSYYRGAHGIAIIFDITNRTSFEHVERWLGEIDKYAKENVLKFLVGNKCDLSSKRTVSDHEAQIMANKYNILYLETSAKEAINTTELFEFAAMKYLDLVQKGQGDKPLGMALNTALLKKSTKKDSCC